MNRLATAICLAATAFAQERPISRPPFDWTRMPVKVVFAPRYPQPPSTPEASAATPAPLETLESRVRKALAGGRIESTPAAEFSAPHGLTGVKLGPEAVMVSTITVDADGSTHVQCEPLPQAVQRMKSPASRTRTPAKETASEK